MIYDIIIIGSGMSGLYAAYNIKKMSPDKSIMILEKHKKQFWKIYKWKIQFKNISNTLLKVFYLYKTSLETKFARSFPIKVKLLILKYVNQLSTFPWFYGVLKSKLKAN